MSAPVKPFVGPSIALPQRQQGIALFISLVLLLVLTIIGVSSVQSTSLEVRMARNDYDSLLAFQAAESALRDAETAVEALPGLAGFNDAGANGLWTIAPMDETPRWEDAAAWAAGTSVQGSEMDEVAAQPLYMIEHVASVIVVENAVLLDDPYGGGGSAQVEMFRITARGTGGTDNAQVFLQSIFGRVM
ncbi:MAG: PilX N-terminal domain-containing pilus assembly protein [Pseudomonadota bacterium]